MQTRRERLWQPSSRFSSAMSPGTTSGTTFYTVTASGSINTKGSYTQIYSSLPFACDGLMVFLEAADNGSARSALTDIAIGAAASEQVVIPNLPSSIGVTGATGPDRFNYWQCWLPIEIPEGTRVAARTQCNVASSNVYLGMMACRTGWPFAGGRMEMNGADTATSKGVSVDAGASANTKGAYAEITPATTFDYAMLWLFVNGDQNAAPQQAQFVLDIAIGGSGSEQIVIPDVPVISGSNGVYLPVATPFFLSVPSGSRLAVRAASTTNDATDRILRVTLLGVN